MKQKDKSSNLLKDYFKTSASSLKELYGVVTIQEAQLLTDEQLLKARNVGKIFVHRLRQWAPHPDLYNCNHHHPIQKDETFVDFGTGRFVADNEMIPLLKELNRIGLTTRTHNYSKEDGHHFVSIILDNVDIEVKAVFEKDANRSKFNGKKEVIISWKSIPTYS